MNKPSLYDRRFGDEATLTKHVKEWLQFQSDLFFWKASDRYHKGVSDIIACVRGIFVGIELKRDTGASSAHQRLFIRDVKHASGVGGVCYTVNEVIALVEEARRRAVQ